MSSERYPGESLPFEPSMRHADGKLIAIIKVHYLQLYYSQNEAKMLNLFNARRVLPKSGTARMTLRLPKSMTWQTSLARQEISPEELFAEQPVTHIVVIGGAP